MGRQSEPLVSALVLERPGTWRWVLGLCVFVVIIAPAVPLLIGVFRHLPEDGLDAWIGSGFLTSLWASLRIGASVAAVSASLGMPLGLVAAVYAFPGRGVFIGLSALPLLVPSFLWAIGLSNLRLPISGTLGAVAAFSSLGVSLVLFATLSALRATTQSQADALRIAGGERLLLVTLASGILPTACLSALLAGVLSLSDSGPGQILGAASVASEILISFSALYDFDLATRQCLALGAVAMVLAMPITLLLGRQLTRPFGQRYGAASVASVRNDEVGGSRCLHSGAGAPGTSSTPADGSVRSSEVSQ